MEALTLKEESLRAENEQLLDRYLKRVEAEADMVGLEQGLWKRTSDWVLGFQMNQMQSSQAARQQQQRVDAALRDVSAPTAAAFAGCARIAAQVVLIAYSAVENWGVPKEVARRIDSADGDVNAIDFSADGTLLACAADACIRCVDPLDEALRWTADLVSDSVYDTRTAQPTAQLRGVPQSVMSVEFSSDGLLVLGGCNDNSARLWDLRLQRLRVRRIVVFHTRLSCIVSILSPAILVKYFLRSSPRHKNMWYVCFSLSLYDSACSETLSR